ncbi:hypothetical protein BJY00DRAFT_250754 [Aspergillus carlsbadensis]|nr:hypothetical protein BJY00DRAFT_250754 [Aspergillus carlsbadensis]
MSSWCMLGTHLPSIGLSKTSCSASTSNLTWRAERLPSSIPAISLSHAASGRRRARGAYQYTIRLVHLCLHCIIPGGRWLG